MVIAACNGRETGYLQYASLPQARFKAVFDFGMLSRRKQGEQATQSSAVVIDFSRSDCSNTRTSRS